MTMPRGVTEIDRLIEQGLSLYGEGDLDGALLLWERVLLIDPENAQANSYVDYVKINYDLLTSDSNTEHSGPFGIGDDSPDYQIEILPGEDIPPVPPAAPLFMVGHDEDWMIGDEQSGLLPVHGSAGDSFELEADEPPLASESVSFDNALTGESVSFEDATREYPGGAGRPAVGLLGEGHAPGDRRTGVDPSDFVPEVTPAFGSVADLHTPPGFGSQVTEMRRRDLGFVQPAATGSSDGIAGGTDRRAPAPGPPEFKMTLRTPGSQSIPLPAAPVDRHRAPTAEGERDDPPGRDDLALDLIEAGEPASASYESLDLELTPEPGPDLPSEVARVTTAPGLGLGGQAGANGPSDAARDAELLASLPAPRPSNATTRPLLVRPRVAADSQPPAEIAADPSGLPPATARSGQSQDLPLTLQLDPLPVDALDPLLPGGPTRDFSERPTNAVGGPPRPEEPLISAPTLELGLRTSGVLAAPRDPLRRPATEDETTREVDVQRVRQARGSGKPELPAMDPIDARSAEILDEIDRGAPASETREDRTRRRITALLERATEWGRGSDLERAVTAVDLALSEDPNSALSQKLIHRNREAIMNAFQGFLGDLQRIPALARPLHELGSAPISPRAAFLLSRVDGTLSLDEILDVSGMPRLEAYRYLCQLFLRGILR